MNAIDRLLAEFEAARERIEEAEQLQLEFWESGKASPPPLLLMADVKPEQKMGLAGFNLKEAHYDSEKMFINGLLGALSALCGGGQSVPSMRANMGCSVYPSLLGVKPRLFEDKMPWVKEHMTKEQLLGIKREDIKITSDFKVALEHMAYMTGKLGDSPLRVFPPDMQGPFDVAHIVYGDDIFYDIYDDPSFLHHLLDISCHALIIGFEASLPILPDSDRLIAHYNNLVIPRSKGGIKISEDTSTLLSPESIDEFVVPYTKRLLDHFGGGYIHYCGKHDYLLEAMLGLDNAIGINFGNPEKHDMDAVLGKIAKAGKVYYGTVNKLPGESESDYISRIRKSSDDRLLLKRSTKGREPSEMLREWQVV